MKIQEFVNPYPNIVLTWLWCSWILPGKLDPEGVELEFRWVIPRQAREKLFGEDKEGDVPMSKADTLLADTCLDQATPSHNWKL